LYPKQRGELQLYICQEINARKCIYAAHPLTHTMTASTSKALANLLRTIDAFRNNTGLEPEAETEGYFQPH